MPAPIVANLLLLASEWQAGQSQADLVSELVNLGFSTIEVRREYFRDISRELPQVTELAKNHSLTLFYSVPDEIFVAEGQVNPKLQGYLDEAKAMGMTKIKWNIGDFAEFSGDLASALLPLTQQGIEINIENDQTTTSGRLQPVLTFLQAVTAANIPIGYVYDLGNWPFVGEDPLKAATALRQYTRYIHVKDDLTGGEKPVTVPLDQGDLPWRDILAILPDTVPIALEYPTAHHDVILAGKKLLQDEQVRGSRT
ncbi:sugar phosphate isomerase epimerase [Lacticaseibacillus zeae DSM 20178 = KCTC 3804]|jgi:sugar phosphate isomerase/epimerase|uniref:TIM barrel protein n=2 Tax=Lacticaseibacillus zeae TaxID=57037 RepID=A0A5R8LW44_LACZE|nr:TIM barrel protein [Lacticaseibacillus zeae]KRK13110.1 sugar phosphate isomerase epimerase [Lacticaseibacillus zeae DSM 20178 = KCTC 3804]OLS06820.1 sugar phosphate isomerase [Lacticaseibacillus casei]QVI31940.1 TIM barrel protein [Lacticaseibacillus zeae]TLF41492.1 TIM barrel protein [Lacticaseibacillus zeae]